MLFRHTCSPGGDWRPTCSSCGPRFHWNTPFCSRRLSTSGIVCHWMIRKHVLCSCFHPPANTFLLLCRQDHFKYMTCIGMWGEKKKTTEFLHFIYILRFLVCISSVSLKMPETSTDKLQSWLSYVSYTWSDFLLFLLTTSPPNAAKMTSMTNSFILTSWFRFCLLKYFCLMVE